MPIMLLLTLALMTSPASAQTRRDGGNVSVRTPSGHAELILLQREPYESIVQLEYVCSQLGWRVFGRSAEDRVQCDLPSKERSGVLQNLSTRALPENFTMLPVRKVVTFEVKGHPQGVHVTAYAERQIPHITNVGQFEPAPIEGQNIKNGLMNIIALAGDSAFVPGTTFANVGYLGFRSDRYSKVEIEGKERTAIQVGAVDPGSPVDDAGLQAGDFIVTMNGKYFDEYRDVSKFLRNLRPGDAVALVVERGGTGERVDLSTVAVDPPTRFASR